MKRAIWIFAIVLGYGVNRVQGQVLASFSLSQNNTASYGYSDAGWTNVYGDPLSGVRTGTANGITISSVSTANWVSNNSMCAEDGVGSSPGVFFPTHILACHWYQASNSGQAVYNQAYPQLELSGLNKDSFYIIRMSASSSYYTVADPTQYTVAGSTVAPSQYQNSYQNTTTGVTFQHIYPDSNGVIKIYVNTTTGKTVAYLAGVQVISGTSTVGIPQISITSPANGDILAEESNITINASASETGGSISKVEFYEDTTKIGEADSPPYKVTWNDPNEGTYMITAKATDASGTASTAMIQISVESLSSFWSTTGNIHMNADSNFVGNVDSVRLAFRTKDLERMSISPTGNVGIGTISPTAQFHTTGTVRLAGIPKDSSGTQPRIIASDSSGNLYYRNASSVGSSPGDGIGQAGGNLELGDSVAGPGAHSFHSNRYQYLNGHIYSFGGIANDPVARPALNIYDNGDLSAGGTMDTSVNLNGKAALRYYAKLGVLQLGATDNLDTTGPRIIYQSQEGAGILMNSDNELNHIKGKLYNSIVAGGGHSIDSSKLINLSIVSGDEMNMRDNVTGSLLFGHAHFLGGYVNNSTIVGQSNNITKPIQVASITGFANTAQDSVAGTFVSGALNQFGGVSQFLAGNELINRTPFGVAMGNANVDFSSQSYTGFRGIAVPDTIAHYPVFVVGNSAQNNGTVPLVTVSRSNALTILYNGRTQINTTGYTNGLVQADVTPKAALEVVSTNSGVLLPKLSSAQRNAIATGDLQNGLLLYNTDSSAFQFYNGSAWHSFASGIAGISGWGSTGNAGTNPASNFVGTTDSEQLVIRTDNLQRMAVLANGSVVIGTTGVPSSDAMLAVKGNIYGQLIRVTQTGWPDYVFKKGYKLLSLEQLGRYISVNRHLPGVLTADDAARFGGLDLGKNQSVLLKKIEELTLYLVAEHKKVEGQQRKIEDQQAEIEDQGAEIEKLKEQNKKLEHQQQEIDELKKLILSKK